MSFNTTIDNLVYEASTQPENVAEKPFIQKEWNNPVYDTNTSAEYNSNQIVFDTTTLMNCGQEVSYSEGIIALPFVIRISSSNAAVNGAGGATANGNDWATKAGLAGTDFMLALKNSHMNLVHSVAVNMNNQDILQPQPLSNAYLIFRQHAELSNEDELLNAPLHGYCKDGSESWSFEAAASSKGIGLCNNANGSNAFSTDVNSTSNEGLRRRHALIQKLGAVNGKALVLGDLNANKPEGKNFIENVDGIVGVGGKYIYYTAFLRLIDLQPDLFTNFPMTKGIKFKITLTLNNNISFTFQKTAAGALTFNQANFSNVTSATNPLMLSASYNVNNSATTVNAINTATGSAVGAVNTPCGSAPLLCDAGDIYTVSMRIGKNNGRSGALTQCILYAPTYRMNPLYEEKYFKDNRMQKVHYTELEYQSFLAKFGDNFNVELASTCVRPKRLIMIGIMSPDATRGNAGIDPLSSPFASEPATTSPFVLSAFNCSVSNNNLYPNDITYSYDNFLQNLNGQTGINSNLVKGLVSSRINLNDFQNNYHYIVVDLSRRLSQFDMVSNSIRVRGQIKSTRDITFHCFIEKERVLEVDVMTGALISRQ
jgi:hypothetical protein